jgi:hypothetical protein
MLQQLSTTTKLGASSYSFLYKLVQTTPELSQQTPTKKRQTHDNRHLPDTLPTEPPPDCAPLSILPNPPAAIVYPPPPTTAPDQFAFDMDYFLANNPFGDMSNPTPHDLGGMEQIWDWEALHLDGFAQNGASI